MIEINLHLSTKKWQTNYLVFVFTVPVKMALTLLEGFVMKV